MSLIKKEDLIERVERYIIGCPIYSDKTKSFVKEILEAEIKYSPAIDSVKHGHWIKVNEGHTWGGTRLVEYECSLCKERVNWHKYSYCPHCGSKMESDKNDIN